MWPALLLSLLAAVLAWCWYRRSGDGTEPGTEGSTAGAELHDRPEPGPYVRERAARTETSRDRTDLHSAAHGEGTATCDLRVGDGASAAGVPARGAPTGDLQGPPTDAPKREDPPDNLQGPPTDAPKKEDPPNNLQGPPTDAPKKEDPPNNLQGPPTDAPKREDPSDNLQGPPTDAPKREDPSDNLQGPPTDAPKREDPSDNLQGPPADASQREDPQDNPQGPPTDEKNLLFWFFHLGHPSDSSLVKEAPNSLKARELLNPDLYLQMVNTLDDVGNTTVADQFKDCASLEKCNLKRRSMCRDAVDPSTGLQENVDAFHGGLNEPIESMSDIQKLGAGPESSSLDISNLVLNQEKERAGLHSSYTDEKTTLCTSSEVNVHEIDHLKTRKIATIQPMPHDVNFSFKVHYITHSDSQIIAIIGDHEKLGKWETYVPLTSGNGGFWSHLITLPVDTNLSWKFVMVENGKIKRWEECNDRFLKIAHEDIEVHLCWGYP
ncbi:Starch-binding domain-containing protein 1 [Pristimantis euphronides]